MRSKIRKRSAALCVFGLLLAGCTASTPGRRTNTVSRGPEDPLPVELNRNAPPPGTRAGVATPHVVLWCAQPLGPACLAAQQELGQAPTPADAVPAPLLAQARDEADDCADPDLAPLMQRVTDAVGVAVGGWTDQEGPIPSPAHIEDLYAGSGCTNAARPGDPPVKMHVADVDGEPHFLVRVWELS